MALPRGLLAGASSTFNGRRYQRSPLEIAGIVDAQLQAGGTFRRAGAADPDLKALAPKGNRRMSANPVANGGLASPASGHADFRKYAVEVKRQQHSWPATSLPLASFFEMLCG